MKKCKKCQNSKPLEDFYVNQFTKDKRRSTCIECWKVLTRRTPEQNRVYRAQNREKLLAYDRERTKNGRWKDPNTQKVQKEWRRLSAAQIKNIVLKRNFGISLEIYTDLLMKQEGCCAICAQPETSTTKAGAIKSLSVDHNHTCCPGKKSCGQCIRGLLCDRCNRAIGLLRDSVVTLTAAASYVATKGA